MPYIELVGSGDHGTDKTYLELRVAGLQNSAYDYYIYIRKDATGEVSSDLGFGYETYSNSVVWTGLAPETTYSFTALVTPDGSYEREYYGSFTTPSRSSGGGGTRPSNYSWVTSKTSGGDFNLTDTEWNGLLSRLNEFRVYKGFPEIATFVYAYKGNDFTAVQFNQAVNTLNSMSSPVSPPGAVTSGDTVYATQLNGLVTSLNSIT